MWAGEASGPLPPTHTGDAGEGVLDSGVNLLVGAVVFLLPARELFVLAATVWNDQTGALIATVGNRNWRVCSCRDTWTCVPAEKKHI